MSDEDYIVGYYVGPFFSASRNIYDLCNMMNITVIKSIRDEKGNIIPKNIYDRSWL